jgi:hypothetical protein
MVLLHIVAAGTKVDNAAVLERASKARGEGAPVKRFRLAAVTVPATSDANRLPKAGRSGVCSARAGGAGGGAGLLGGR